MVKLKDLIDWKAAEEFVRRVMPILGHDLESELPELNTLGIVISMNGYPPSIQLRFLKKGLEKYALESTGNLTMSDEQEKEFRRNKDEILLAIGNVASINGLSVRNGFKRSTGEWIDALGYYTLKPDYKQFKISPAAAVAQRQ